MSDQQQNANSAGDSEIILSIADPSPDFYSQAWHELHVPLGVNANLARIERAAAGLHGVTEILRRDTRSCRDRDANDGVAYQELPAPLRERLEEAQEVLVSSIQDELGNLRDFLRVHGEREPQR